MSRPSLSSCERDASRRTRGKRCTTGHRDRDRAACSTKPNRHRNFSMARRTSDWSARRNSFNRDVNIYLCYFLKVRKSGVRLCIDTSPVTISSTACETWFINPDMYRSITPALYNSKGWKNSSLSRLEAVVSMIGCNSL